MPRYIDADALYERTAELEASALAKIEELNRTPLEELDDNKKALWRMWTSALIERSAFKHDVFDAQTADVVEVRHGKWLYSNAGNWKCSLCGDEPYYDSKKGLNYCPNCGAKMDGDYGEIH